MTAKATDNCASCGNVLGGSRYRTLAGVICHTCHTNADDADSHQRISGGISGTFSRTFRGFIGMATPGTGSITGDDDD